MQTHGFPQTLVEAIRYFSDLDVCHQYVTAMRWPRGVTCPYCGGKELGFISTRREWRCKNKECGKQFSVKIGTIFEDSPIKLDKWLTAIWLMVSAKNGVSSWEIHRSLGVTQKTAWFMEQRIRLALHMGTFEKLKGQVEVDETFIGGKARNMHPGKRKAKGRGTIGKEVIMGLLERHGDNASQVIVKHVANRKGKTLTPEVRAHVEPDSEVFTDALKSYDDLCAEYIHQVIDHAEKYVDGQIHTNGMENFWSLLKRCIKGTHVSIEPFHLFRYLDEESFRFNHRKGTDAQRFALAVSGIVGKRLTYKHLTGKLESQRPEVE